MNPGVTFHVLGSARECEGMNPTFPNELSLWDLESQWAIVGVKNH